MSVRVGLFCAVRFHHYFMGGELGGIFELYRISQRTGLALALPLNDVFQILVHIGGAFLF